MGCEVNMSTRRLREWLRIIGWSFKSAASGKGEYVDGHERPDVVAARVIFVQKMTALFEKMEHYQDGLEKEMEVVIPRHDVQARQHVLTVQDESCFFSSDGSKRLWMPENQRVLLPKSNGTAIMVSEYLCPCHGKFGAVKSIKPGVNKDGYWVNDDVIAQVQEMLPLWEARHPDCTGVFMFDHSSNHMKLPDDALRTSVMNAGSGGTNRVTLMRNTTWFDADGESHVQIMGHKGLKEVLQERGLAYTNVPEARNLLDAQPDFLAQKPAIQEILEKRGHIVVWCPKFHPEFNIIERYWGMVKFIMRGKCDYTFATLQEQLPAPEQLPQIAYMFVDGFD